MQGCSARERFLQCEGGVPAVQECEGGVPVVLECEGGVPTVLECEGGAQVNAIFMPNKVIYFFIL